MRGLPAIGVSILVACLPGRAAERSQGEGDALSEAERIYGLSLVRSAGSTGQPLVIDLPGAGAIGIASKRDTMPDGTEFVGYGIEPHIFVEQTVRALRAGRDLVLEAAVKAVKDRLDNDPDRRSREEG